MDGERISRAKARIEQAARRIEAAAAMRPTAPADPEESRRYQKLRTEAGAALAELDQLLLALEP